MQLDAEMSFVTQDDVIGAISEAVLAAAEAITGERSPDIERITWREAMERFGVDKPDLRFGIELVELTDLFVGTEFKAFAGAGAVKGLRVPGVAGEYGRNQLDKLTDRAKQLGAKGLVWLKVAADGSFESPVAKFLSPAEADGLATRTGAEPGDLVLVVADEWMTTCEVLGQLRNDLARPPVHEGPYRYVWVVDFPMFVVDAETGQTHPAHHPFTMPHLDDLELLTTDPAAARSQAYDLVLNGWELGSGSIRIHDPDLQRRVFAALGIGRRGGRAQVRLLPRLVRVRRPAPRRVRLRHRPARRHPRRRGEHPRGDRLPEDPVGIGSDDPVAAAGRPGPARRAGHPRPPTVELARWRGAER